MKRFRSSGFCVATPTGQVSRWQTTHHYATLHHQRRGENPYSSAPSKAAMTTSRPVFIEPSAWTTTRSRKPLRSRVCCVSARPKLPGATSVFGRAHRGRPGPAVVARNEYDIGVGLGHPGRHCPHPRLGHQFHVDPRPGVGVFQVVNELRQVLDRIDVVVWRGRDQPHPRRRVTGLGYPGVYLLAR